MVTRKIWKEMYKEHSDSHSIYMNIENIKWKLIPWNAVIKFHITSILRTTEQSNYIRDSFLYLVLFFYLFCFFLSCIIFNFFSENIFFNITDFLKSNNKTATAAKTLNNTIEMLKIFSMKWKMQIITDERKNVQKYIFIYKKNLHRQ